MALALLCIYANALDGLIRFALDGFSLTGLSSQKQPVGFSRQVVE